MKKSKASALALSTVSALALPQYAQAVAMYEAEASATLTLSNLSLDLELGEWGAWPGASTNTLYFEEGDASHTFDGTGSAFDQVNRTLSVDLKVTGKAGEFGSSGRVSNRQYGEANVWLYCDSENGDCTYTLAWEPTNSHNATTDYPSFETATADADVDFSLRDFPTNCTEITGLVSTAGWSCTLAAGTAVELQLYGYAEGSAEARYPTAVPEPATLALFSVGAMGLAAFRRRKTKSE